MTDINFVYATTARPRGMVKEVITPEQAGTDMRARSAEGRRSAILFGRERWGLDNDEVSLADIIITAPVNPAFASLNIAQAVLLVGYEWYKDQAARLSARQRRSWPHLQGPACKTPDTRPATKEELYGFFDHLESELDEAGFFKTPEKKPGMVRNMRNLFAARRAHRAGSPLAARHGRLAHARASAEEGKSRRNDAPRILLFDSGMGGLTVAAGGPAPNCPTAT